MNKEFLKMQKLAGLISENQFKQLTEEKYLKDLNEFQALVDKHGLQNIIFKVKVSYKLDDKNKWQIKNEGDYISVQKYTSGGEITEVQRWQESSGNFLASGKIEKLPEPIGFQDIALVAVVSNEDNPKMILDPKTKKPMPNPNYKENTPSKTINKY